MLIEKFDNGQIKLSGLQKQKWFGSETSVWTLSETI